VLRIVEIVVYGCKRNTMKNCNVSHSKYHGLGVCDGGLMKIDGNATTIHHNGKSDGYGLLATSSSSIHLVSPLTKEMISTNNHGGRNYRIIVRNCLEVAFNPCSSNSNNYEQQHQGRKEMN